jgi:hypothetical protein
MIIEGQIVWQKDPDLIRGPKLSKRFGDITYFREFTPAPPRPQAQKPATPPVDKGKGKEVPQGAPTGAKPPATKQQGGPSEEKGKGKEERPDPLTGQNPLRAKGVPRTSLLTAEQNRRLRAALGIPEPHPAAPEVWDQWTPKQKSEFRKSFAIPHWASNAVIENPGNLDLIEQKTLTLDNHRTMRLPRPETTARKSGDIQREVSEAWVKAKKAYPGVKLWANPTTKKEKALKNAFDQLVKEFGKHPSLPKPKTKPGSSTAEVGFSNRGTGLEGLIPIVQFIGQLTRAFRG